MSVLERVPMGFKKLFGEDGTPVLDTYFSREKLWFEEKPFSEPNLLHYLGHELLRRGIGESQCPTIPEWMTYVLGGAVIAYLNGTLPTLEGSYFHGDIEEIVWGNLWLAARKPARECDRVFLGNVLSLFALHSHHAPPEKPYHESWFRTGWRFGGSPTDGQFRSIGNLRIPILKPYASVPKKTQSAEYQRDLDGVAAIVPETLEIAVANIRQTYHW